MTFKEFWTSKSVLINVGITTAILMFMAIVVTVLILSTGCSLQSTWVRDTQPTLRYLAPRQVGQWKMQSFTISNPGKCLTTGTLECKDVNDKVVVFKKITLQPTTNKIVSLVLPEGLNSCIFTEDK